MFVVFVILTVIVSVLMILIVLVQKSKGGGLSSQFGGGNQVLGVRGTNTFLEKTTSTQAPCGADRVVSWKYWRRCVRIEHTQDVLRASQRL